MRAKPESEIKQKILRKNIEIRELEAILRILKKYASGK